MTKIILILLVVSFVGLAIVFRNTPHKNNFTDYNPLPKTSDGESANKLMSSCKHYDNSPKSAFLVPYTVKEGDTLLSIAKKQLGDVSLVNDIVILNKEFFPSLSIQTPFIEKGWTLYLAPKSIRNLKYDLIQVNGELARPSGDSWWKIYSHEGMTPFIPGEQTQSPPLESFKERGCVTMIKEKDLTGRVFSLTPQ